MGHFFVSLTDSEKQLAASSRRPAKMAKYSSTSQIRIHRRRYAVVARFREENGRFRQEVASKPTEKKQQNKKNRSINWITVFCTSFILFKGMK